MKIYNNITELIGKTPIVKLNKIDDSLPGNIYAKIESFNPLSSVKDRLAISMITEAEKSGALKKGMTLIEPTSGNTGVGLAFICASKGYDLILTMPDTMSVERRKLLSALGAQLVLTPGAEGMKGAINKADELADGSDDKIILQQFSNPANPKIHRETTAVEILEDMDGKVDYFVAGVGTGGTITGVGEVLKEKIKDIQIIAIEPKDSPVLSGGAPGPHKIQGIGAGFVPDVMNLEIVDKVIKVSNDDAISTAKKLSLSEGILSGISSGAALCGAIELASLDENKDKNIVVVLPDTGERYLSMDIFK
jgi:cysteine synthase